MSEPNSLQNVEGMATPDDPDDVERLAELTDTWGSSPLTDPVEAQDPAAGPLAEHGDSERPEHPTRRPDF